MWLLVRYLLDFSGDPGLLSFLILDQRGAYQTLLACVASKTKVLLFSYFPEKMETLKIFIKTEEGEEEEEKDIETQFPLEETPCPEPLNSEG